MLSKLEKDLEILENKKRFIEEVIADVLRIKNVKKKIIVIDLINRGYKKFKDMTKILSTKLAMKEDPTVR